MFWLTIFAVFAARDIGNLCEVADVAKMRHSGSTDVCYHGHMQWQHGAIGHNTEVQEKYKNGPHETIRKSNHTNAT